MTMKKYIFISFFIIVSIFWSNNIELTADLFLKERTFFIEERIRLKDLPEDADDVRIWIPYPVNDNWQKISDFKVVHSPRPSVEGLGSFDVSFITDREYGNKIIFLKSKKNQDVDMRASEIIVSFKVQRKEYRAGSNPPVSYKTLSRFLKPNSQVPVNGKLKALAQRITRGKVSDLEKVRAIYDYVIDELTYADDDPRVCGMGNSLLTLEFKKGICTDYHSLFISLVRSIKIPAKFEIGFPIHSDKEEGIMHGYHCWAKFYLRGEGWIPVDISEADKHPEKRDYFFGHIDENRVHLTTGRDIKLMYAGNSPLLNFFIYPYAHLNGVPFNNVDFEIYFRDLKGGEK